LTEVFTETFTENLTEKEIEVLRLMKENQEYTTSDMAVKLDNEDNG
jgi:hypothetical protein